ncbi:MAG: pyridoxal phosphate-dependent aminotransferase [Clostridia bacterium]|nr:pyridoxal phosphate-dependent aminotransferase [Clostridia bacterium]
MKEFDFDGITDRRNTGSCKWNVAPGELPMWVADMDFRTAPSVINALEKRVSHGVFGYTEPGEEWAEAYISWWKRRHGWEMKPEWLMFCTGVVPAISSTVRKICTPNENVVIQTPVYNIFFNSIVNNGCRVLENPLIYENGRYFMNFEDLEEKLANPQTSLMILCNPHNPVGRIWSAEELAEVGRLAVKYGVTVVADEIHCDITAPGRSYVPFASVSDDCAKCGITCISPTKCFGIPGIQTAAIAVSDPFLRHKVWRGINTDEVAEPNAFAVEAAVAAFEGGEDWLDALNVYLSENRRTACEFIRDEIRGIKAVEGEATYLLWIDLKDLPDPGSTDRSSFYASEIRKRTGLFVVAGEEYGGSGKDFLRMNLACPRSTLTDGLARLKKGFLQLI